MDEKMFHNLLFFLIAIKISDYNYYCDNNQHQQISGVAILLTSNQLLRLTVAKSLTKQTWRLFEFGKTRKAN